MRIPNQSSGVGTTGLTGIVLLIAHITGHITGWGWLLLYVPLIISGIGQENRRLK